MKIILFITTLTVSLFSLNAGAVNISNVFHGAVKNSEVEIRFNLSETADTQIKFYDDRDYLIRKIVKGKMDKGDHSVVWNLKDDNELRVPPEAYKYTIVATGVDGKEVIHDLSDITGNESITVNDAQLNKATGEVDFILKKPSRVHIRAGLSGGGPLLVTLLNWVSRDTGLNKVKWNGLDASGVINIQNHEKLYLSVQAYSLSDNTIIVGKDNSKVNFIDTSAWVIQKRKNIVLQKKKMIAAYQQPPETRGDFSVSLDITQKYKKEGNVPVVNGTVSVRLNVDKDSMATIINQRAEPVFYIDGIFSYENEVGFYPMVWQLDTSNLNDGEHFLTVNLRGYEGNFGIASKKIIVRQTK